MRNLDFMTEQYRNSHNAARQVQNHCKIYCLRDALNVLRPTLFMSIGLKGPNDESSEPILFEREASE